MVSLVMFGSTFFGEYIFFYFSQPQSVWKGEKEGNVGGKITHLIKDAIRKERELH